MAQSINIDVTITQELRDLYLNSHLMPVVEESLAEAHVQQAPAPPEQAHPDWTPVKLRRDGERPLQFSGLEIVSFSGPLTYGDWDCDQHVSLFLSENKTLYLALALRLPENASSRSLHCCLELAYNPGPRFLDSWFEQIRVHVVGALEMGASPFDESSDLIGGFHALTAHCFQAKQVQATRNETCLQ